MMASLHAADRAAKREADKVAAAAAADAAANDPNASKGPSKVRVRKGSSDSLSNSTKQLGAGGRRGSTGSVGGQSRPGSVAGSTASLGNRGRPKLGNAHEFAQPFFSEGGVNYAAQQVPSLRPSLLVSLRLGLNLLLNAQCPLPNAQLTNCPIDH